MTTDFHPVQASILRELLFKNGTNFASLNKMDLTSDHFTFHIKKLLAEGLIEKTGPKYSLTQQGKVVAGTLDIESLKTEKWGKASVAIACVKKIGAKKYILMQQRLKEPFYGHFGFINGKIRYGDSSYDTAVRELKEETGLTGKPITLCVYHKMRGPNRDHVTLDNFFIVYLVKNPTGNLIDTAEGKNSWFEVSQAQKLNTFPGFENLWKIVLSQKVHPYFEEFHIVENI